MAYSIENGNTQENQNTKKRAKGYDTVRIIQSGHIFFTDVKAFGKGAKLIIGVKSQTGYTYDKNEDYHNDVAIYWEEYYANADYAKKAADAMHKGKFVTIIGDRLDYNVKNDEGNFERKNEIYRIEKKIWGTDFNMK